MTHPTSPAGIERTASPATAADVTVGPGLVDGVDVDAVARAVRACAGVADLYSGRLGEIGSYLPGRRVGGVLVDDDAVTVHIRARWGYAVRDLLEQVSAVTVALRNGRRLDLAVDDIDDDDLNSPATPTTDAATAIGSPRATEFTVDTPAATNPPAGPAGGPAGGPTPAIPLSPESSAP